MLLLMAAGPAAAGALPGERVESISLSEITARDGKVWVDVKEYPVDGLFEEMGRAAGFEVAIDKSYARRVITVRFNGVPLEEAVSRLVRLLDTKNYRLAYRDDGSVKRLEIFKSVLSRGGTETPAAVRQGSAPPRRRVERPGPGPRELRQPGGGRMPVRRRLAAPPDEGFEEDQWVEEEFLEEEVWEEEQFGDQGEELPYLEPVGEVQRFP